MSDSGFEIANDNDLNIIDLNSIDCNLFTADFFGNEKFDISNRYVNESYDTNLHLDQNNNYHKNQNNDNNSNNNDQIENSIVWIFPPNMMKQSSSILYLNQLWTTPNQNHSISGEKIRYHHRPMPDLEFQYQ